MSEGDTNGHKKIYLTTITIELPFEHDTPQDAEHRCEVVCDYVLKSVPDAVVTPAVSMRLKRPE